MVSANVSSKRMPLVESARLYDTVISALGAGDPQVLGISLSLSDINGRLLNDISANLITSFDVMKTELNTALRIVKDVASDVNTIPTITAREVASMPAMLRVGTSSTIPPHVKMLLANFQNAVEDPKTLYPRLVCCDLPVDPAKMVNFARRHHLLDQVLQEEEAGEHGDRSMPSAPKSAEDVITNVNSSLESVSDLLCESVDNVAGLSETCDAIRVAAEDLACIKEPVNEAMNQQEQIRRVFAHISSMFSHGEKDNSFRNGDTEDNQDAMQVVNNASSLIENLAATRFGEYVLPRVQNAKGILSEFVKNLAALISRLRKAVLKLVSALRKFISSLPRIARELRQFFVPTGFRALLMKPSPDLMSLLQSIEELRTVLPEPHSIEKSASDTLGPEGLVKRVSNLLDKFSQLDIAQRKLFESIQNQKLSLIISDTVLETLENILRDLRGSIAGVLDLSAHNMDADDMAHKLKKILPFGTQDYEDKPGREDQRSAELVANVTGAGPFLGRLFES